MEQTPHILAMERSIAKTAAGSFFIEFATEKASSLKVACRVVTLPSAPSGLPLECRISSSSKGDEKEEEKKRQRLLEYEVKSVIGPLLLE